MSSGDDSSPTVSIARYSTAYPILPTELWFHIVSGLFGEYVDQLISDKEPSHVDEVEDELNSAARNNPISPLLRVSYQVREVTLKVVSEAMNISKGADGRLSVKPWSLIRPVLEACWIDRCTNSEINGRIDELLSDSNTPFKPSLLLLLYLHANRVECVLRSIRSVGLAFDCDSLDSLMKVTIPSLGACFLGCLKGIKPSGVSEIVSKRAALVLWSASAVFRLNQVCRGITDEIKLIVDQRHMDGEEEEEKRVLRKHMKRIQLGLMEILHHRRAGEALRGFLSSHMNAFESKISYRFFMMINVFPTLEATEKLKGYISNSQYSHCRAIVREIVQYWLSEFPQISTTACALLEGDEDEDEDEGSDGDSDDEGEESDPNGEEDDETPDEDETST